MIPMLEAPLLIFLFGMPLSLKSLPSCMSCLRWTAMICSNPVVSLVQQWNPCFHESSISFVNITCCFIPQSPKHLDLLGHLVRWTKENSENLSIKGPPLLSLKALPPKNPPILGTKLMSSRQHPWHQKEVERPNGDVFRKIISELTTNSWRLTLPFFQGPPFKDSFNVRRFPKLRRSPNPPASCPHPEGS